MKIHNRHMAALVFAATSTLGGAAIVGLAMLVYAAINSAQAQTMCAGTELTGIQECHVVQGVPSYVGMYAVQEGVSPVQWQLRLQPPGFVPICGKDTAEGSARDDVLSMYLTSTGDYVPSLWAGMRTLRDAMEDNSAELGEPENCWLADLPKWRGPGTESYQVDFRGVPGTACASQGLVTHWVEPKCYNGATTIDHRARGRDWCIKGQPDDPMEPFTSDPYGMAHAAMHDPYTPRLLEVTLVYDPVKPVSDPGRCFVADDGIKWGASWHTEEEPE